MLVRDVKLSLDLVGVHATLPAPRQPRNEAANACPLYPMVTMVPFDTQQSPRTGKEVSSDADVTVGNDAVQLQQGRELIPRNRLNLSIRINIKGSV